MRATSVTGHVSCADPNGDLLLGGINGDRTIGVEFAYDGSLDARRMGIIQAAIVYTTAQGERRLRVHTRWLPVAQAMPNLFQVADCDALFQTFVRRSIDLMFRPGFTVRTVAAPLVSAVVNVLATYRKHCAASRSTSSTLIMPESLRFLPVYLLAALKHGMFRPEAAIRPDERVYEMLRYYGATPDVASRMIYPRLFPLHKFPSTAGVVDDETQVVGLPGALPLTARSMDLAGAYALDNGYDTLVWIGAALAPAFLQQVLNVPSLGAVSADALSLRPLDNEYSQRVSHIVEAVRDRGQSVLFVKSDDTSELTTAFVLQLVEDATQVQ